MCYFCDECWICNVGEFNWDWLVCVVGCWLQILRMPTNQSAAICSAYSCSQQCVMYIDNITLKRLKAVGERQKSSPSICGLASCWLSLVNIPSEDWGVCCTFLLPHDCYSFSFEIWWFCLPKFTSSSPISLSSAILIHLFPKPSSARMFRKIPTDTRRCAGSGQCERSQISTCGSNLANQSAAICPPYSAVSPQFVGISHWL